VILYNVTINIAPEVHDEWLQWMKAVHVPEVLGTGLFREGKIMRVLTTESGEGHTYSIQYLLDTMEHYREYEQRFAKELQRVHTERYRDKFVAFRSLLESV